jgi:hypothetical protein
VAVRWEALIEQGLPELHEDRSDTSVQHIGAAFVEPFACRTRRSRTGDSRMPHPQGVRWSTSIHMPEAHSAAQLLQEGSLADPPIGATA